MEPTSPSPSVNTLPNTRPSCHPACFVSGARAGQRAQVDCAAWWATELTPQSLIRLLPCGRHDRRPLQCQFPKRNHKKRYSCSSVWPSHPLKWLGSVAGGVRLVTMPLHVAIATKMVNTTSHCTNKWAIFFAAQLSICSTRLSGLPTVCLPANGMERADRHAATRIKPAEHSKCGERSKQLC